MRRRAHRGPGILPAAAALLVAAAVAPAAAQDDPASLLATGRDAYEAGDWDRARAALWEYLDTTAAVTGPSVLPQAEALWLIALMEPDANVAARYYETIAGEYPAASVADRALFRLGVFALVDGRPEEALARFQRLRTDYPFSRLQPEIPLWIGRTYMVEGSPRLALDWFIQGYTAVKSSDLPMEMGAAQREALAAEYAWWLATAYAESGDRDTAQQYWTMLVLDYPGSPQASEAAAALEGRARPGGELAVEAAGERLGAPAAGFEPTPEDEPADEPFGEAPADDIAAATPPVEERDLAPPPDAGPFEEPAGAGDEAPAQDVARGVPADDPLADPAKFPPPGSAVWLQVGAFTSASRAADLSKRLKADGFETKVEIGIVEGRGYYRVRVGPFRLPGDAGRLDESRRRLEELGFPAQPVREGE